jgi:hypothetical protein
VAINFFINALSSLIKSFTRKNYLEGLDYLCRGLVDEMLDKQTLIKSKDGLYKARAKVE